MKAKELREMNESDLKQKRASLQKEQVDLRFKHSAHHLKDPLKLKYVRRDIARINTILTEKSRSN